MIALVSGSGGWVALLLFWGLALNFCSLVLSSSRLLNCLIVVESLNVLLLMCSLLFNGGDYQIFFVALMVIFTIEVVLGLVVLTRIWDAGDLMVSLGW